MVEYEQKDGWSLGQDEDAIAMDQEDLKRTLDSFFVIELIQRY